MQQNQNTALKRWPDYTVEGDGNIAVVFACCHRIVLVSFVLEATQRVAATCGCQCVIDTNPKMHTAYRLDELPRKPRPSMKRLPGWDED